MIKYRKSIVPMGENDEKNMPFFMFNMLFWNK